MRPDRKPDYHRRNLLGSRPDSPPDLQNCCQTMAMPCTLRMQNLSGATAWSAFSVQRAYGPAATSCTQNRGMPLRR